MRLSNRCVLPPMGTELSNRDGTVSEANIAYITRQAQSSVGLVITEVAGVHPSGTLGIAAWDDKFLPGLKKMADVVHKAGTKTALQLHHAGREAPYQLKKGTAIGPSAIPSQVYGIPPKEMTKEETQTIIESFGKAAIRAQEAGFDAVEVHGAHGYLLTQFLSALSNQREDEYGGSFKERSRFIIEVVKEIRRCVGKDFPILFRISAEESIQHGYVVEDVQAIMPDLVNAGVDVIHASIGTHGSPGGVTCAPPEYEEGWNAWRAEKLKEVVDIPVIAVGRFSDPRGADELIGRGKIDMVAFGRQALADPDYLNKAREGRFDEIRRCLACNQGCIERIMLEPGSSIRCAINPETGLELIYPRDLAEKKRKVWVIGAGPAGLVAADEAARLGHDVTLFEKGSEPGGQIRFASRAPVKEHYSSWIDWLVKQVEKKGVPIKSGVEVTEAMLEKAWREGDLEVVILAGGARNIVPDFKGVDAPMVCDALKILGGDVAPGENIVIIGGGLIGMETADFLMEKGKKVSVVEMLKHSPVLKFTGHGYQLHKRLRTAGYYFNSMVEGIEGSDVILKSDGDKKRLKGVDQVVLAVGMRPREELQDYLKAHDIPHHIVGDARGVRRIIDATEEGARAAWAIA